MRVSLDQLETFYWVARLGSFHAAARHQRLTQPTISVRIRELETHLGIRLFDRGHSRAVITARGRDLLVSAERIIRAAQELDTLAAQRDPMHGLLRLGVVESVATAGLTRFIERVRNRFPHLRLELTVDVGAILAPHLSERSLDMAVLSELTDSAQVSDRLIGRSEFQWIASPLLVPDRDELTPAEMAAIPIITIAPPSAHHRIVADWLREGGRRIEQPSVCNSLSTIGRIVAAGHAASILQPAMMRSELDRGAVRVLRVRPSVRPRPIYVSSLRGERRGGMAVLIRLMRESLLESGLLMAG